MMSPSTYLRETLRLAFPLGIRSSGRFMALLSAYLDDSGTHRGSKMVVLAGMLADQSAWERLTDGWQSVLAEYELPFFHMSKWSNRARPFDTWTDDQRRDCLNRLLILIQSCVAKSVGVGIPNALFESCTTESDRSYWGGPYGLAAYLLLTDMADSVQALSVERSSVRCILESGTLGSTQILAIYQKLRASNGNGWRWIVDSLSFEDKRQFLPLQAADVLAYELYRYLPKPRSAKMARYPLRELAITPHQWWTPDADTIRLLAHRRDL